MNKKLIFYALFVMNAIIYTPCVLTSDWQAKAGQARKDAQEWTKDDWNKVFKPEKKVWPVRVSGCSLVLSAITICAKGESKGTLIWFFSSLGAMLLL